MKSDVASGPGERLWPPKAFHLMWNELWPPLAIFAVYALLLHDYWIGPTRLPLHDSLHIYENFAVAYNHFFETGALPQWLPYSSSYGISNYPDNVMNIPPFYLVTLVAGAALDIKNTWSLFECALALDVAFFTLGSYLLARQFSSRGAATVITAGIVWMLVLDWNFYFTLRLVALMPLALFFLVQWARRESLVSLSLAVATVLLGCLGVPQYFAPFYALFYLSCTVALWVADRPALRVPNLLAFAGIGLFAIAAAGAVAYLYVASIRGLYFVTSARDLTTAKADLDVFLNYGGLQVLKVLEPFVAVPTENKTALFYAGSVVTVLTLYAFWRVRTRELWAFTVLLGVFILFCWGPYSPVARLAYYFPGMSYFRHVGLMYAVPKVLLGIIAAIGLGSVLGRLNASRGDLARVSFVIGVVSIAIAAAYFPLAELINRVFVVWDRPSSIMLLVAAVGGFGAVGLIFSKAKTTAIVPLLLLTTLVQGALYQHLFRDNLRVPWQVPAEVTHVRPIEFIEIRETGGMRKKSLYDAIAERGEIYQQLDSFLQIDACAPNTRVEYVARGVHQLMQRVFGEDVTYAKVRTELSGDRIPRSIGRVLGCGVSKVQWVPGRAVESATSGDKLLTDCVDRTLCLESPNGGQKAVPWVDGEPPAAPSLSSQGIALDHFSFNDIVMSLTVNSAGWLVYADAFFPGWQAEVDGKSVPIWRANFAFKAVELDSGRHTVRFYFYDPTYKWVFWGSGVIGTAAIIVLFVIAFRRQTTRSHKRCGT